LPGRETFIRRNLAGQKTKQAKSRRNMLDGWSAWKRCLRANHSARFRFDLNSPKRDVVFKLTKVAVGYEARSLAKNTHGTVFRGRNVGIIGPNGSEIHAAEDTAARQTPLAGKIQVGQKVELAYYDSSFNARSLKPRCSKKCALFLPWPPMRRCARYLARFFSLAMTCSTKQHR
jgi:ATP-binding cassette subfamily F protein 3